VSNDFKLFFTLFTIFTPTYHCQIFPTNYYQNKCHT